MRLHAQTATIENGFVWLPDEVPWLADCLAESAAYPRPPRRPGRFHRPGVGLGQTAAYGGGGLDRVLAAEGGGRVRALRPRWPQG
jgi:hypothetical protein